MSNKIISKTLYNTLKSYEVETPQVETDDILFSSGEIHYKEDYIKQVKVLRDDISIDDLDNPLILLDLINTYKTFNYEQILVIDKKVLKTMTDEQKTKLRKEEIIRDLIITIKNKNLKSENDIRIRNEEIRLLEERINSLKSIDDYKLSDDLSSINLGDDDWEKFDDE